LRLLKQEAIKMSNKSTGDLSVVKKRQDPLIATYHTKPAVARITDHARTVGGPDTDPFHGNVVLGDDDTGVNIPFGLHTAVGGYSDKPNPGDILCGAVAACLDSTIRIIADRLGVAVSVLEVTVAAELDVRGTLMVDRNAQVGFGKINVSVDAAPSDDVNIPVMKKLIRTAERSCVVIQTLKRGAEVETKVDIGRSDEFMYTGNGMRLGELIEQEIEGDTIPV